MKKISILFIIGEFPPLISGIGDYTNKLSAYLDQNLFEISIITSKVDNFPEVQYDGNICILRIIEKWNASGIYKIVKHIKTKPYSIIHIQYPTSNKFHRNIAINMFPYLMRMLLNKCKTVITHHEFSDVSYKWRFRALLMSAPSHGIIFVNNYDKEYFKKIPFYRNKLIEYIPIGSNIAEYYMEDGQKEILKNSLDFKCENIVICFFGIIVPQKGLEYLLDALAILNQVCNKYSLLVIGGFNIRSKNKIISNYQNSIADKIKAFGTSFQIKVVEAPNEEIVSKLLRISNIAVFPFINGAKENNGSLIAAIQHNLPIISVKGKYTPDFLSSDCGVHFVKELDAINLADSINNIVANSEIRSNVEDMQTRENRFSWIEIARKCENYYRTI